MSKLTDSSPTQSAKTLEETISEADKTQEKSENECKESDISLQVKAWQGSDVVQWLVNKNLQKFIPLFEEYHMRGQDLIELNLPFLKNYEHVNMEEKEILLSEIYNLLNPGDVHASEEDLTKIKSPVDKKKYYAAIELAQVKNDVPRAHSVFVLSSNNSTGKCSSLTRSSPVIKARHKSESAVQRVSRARRDSQEITKKRKMVPKQTERRSLYDHLEGAGSQCVQCIALSAEYQEQVGVTVNCENHVVVCEVPESLQSRIQPGDRVLEINGHILQQPMPSDSKIDLTALLRCQTPAKLVVLVETAVKDEGRGMEKKWNQLHAMLVEMRDSENVVEMSMPPQRHIEQQHSVDQSSHLQEEIQALKKTVREQQEQSELLQQELEDREAMMHDLQLSRDKAIEKLHQTRSAITNKNSRENVGGAEYFNLTMESLQLEDKTKEDVVDSLKEIVLEASKQKWYLDRLISLVIEESPWLLDDVDAEFDNLTLSDKSEEYC